MNPRIRPLSLRHYDGDLWCKARREWRRWAVVRDCAGMALVLILTLAAIYVFAAVLNSMLPPVGVGQ